MVLYMILRVHRAGLVIGSLLFFRTPHPEKGTTGTAGASRLAPFGGTEVVVVVVSHGSHVFGAEDLTVADVSKRECKKRTGPDAHTCSAECGVGKETHFLAMPPAKGTLTKGKTANVSCPSGALKPGAAKGLSLRLQVYPTCFGPNLPGLVAQGSAATKLEFQ